MSNYQIGVGKYDITGPAAEVGMLGYSEFNQRSHGILTRQYSRAFIIDDGNKKVCIVNADLWCCTQAVKNEVVEQLKGLFEHENLLLEGIHTHSGASGISHYLTYNLASLGFIKQNFDAVCAGITESIMIAHNNMKGGKIFYNEGEIDNCGGNRSPIAWEKNPEASLPNAKDTDNTMYLLKFVADNGKPLGCINWYPLHGTCMSQFNELINGDNKGLAAQYFEKHAAGELQSTDFIAAFGNSNCGDVSPNVTWGKRPSENGDDLQRLLWYGKMQFEKALELFETASEEVSGPVDFIHKDVLMYQYEHTDEEKNIHRKTYPGALGMSVFAGAWWDSAYGLQLPFGLPQPQEGMIVANTPRKSLRFVRLMMLALAFAWRFHMSLACKWPKWYKKGQYPKPIAGATGISWPPQSPQHLPIQGIFIGRHLLNAFPGELTTVSGNRLKKTVEATVKDKLNNVNVIHACYANTYCSYTATEEEYPTQQYEGASTLFGPHQLSAFLHAYQYMYNHWKDGNHRDEIMEKAIDKGRELTNKVAKKLSRWQICYQPGVLFDRHPIGKRYGTVKTSINATTFDRNNQPTAVVSFWTGHPKNDLRTEGTFLEIQRQTSDGNWQCVYTDDDITTSYRWTRKSFMLATSYATISWRIPSDAKPGTYRIVHHGNAKPLFRKVKEFSGESRTFTIN